MERKYYLRGLGIGIAVTAIIMGIALSGDQAMTDDEIIARARELGMVENTVLADMDGGDAEEKKDDAGKQDDAASQNASQTRPEASAPDNDGTAQDENRPADGGEENQASEEEAGGADKASSSDAQPQDNRITADARPQDDTITADDGTAAGSEPPASAGGGREEEANEIITSAAVKTIVVSSGDGSYTVAKKLADVGVVTSAETFDTFLCQNGYDKRLRPGTFSIPADASDEQIARIVTGAE